MTTRDWIASSHVARAASLLLIAAAAATAVEPKREFYVVETKPPAIAVVDSGTLKVTGTIPLAADPTFALMSKDNRFLYVLHGGMYKPGGIMKEGSANLSVLDLAGRREVRNLPLGWNTTNMSLTKTGRYLLCFSRGKAGKDKKSGAPNLGSVTIVDTQTNQVSATLSPGRLGKQVVFSGDASRIFVLSEGGGVRPGPARTSVPLVRVQKPAMKKGSPLAPVLTVFRLDSEQPMAEIEIPRAERMALSSDERWLYVLDSGTPSKNPKKNVNGTVYVIDTETGKQTGTVDVGVAPKELFVEPESGSAMVLARESMRRTEGKLYRFTGSRMESTGALAGTPISVNPMNGQRGSFLITAGSVHTVNGEGALSSSFVPLKSKPAAGKSAEEKDQPAGIGGVPGEVLHLPGQDRLAMTVRTPAGAPTSTVALVNLKDHRLERTVTTGRGSVKFGNFMAAMAVSVAMSSLSYYAGYSFAQATGSPYFVYNVYVYSPPAPNLELAAAADGKYVYALNQATKDVTVIDSTTGDVINKIAVGGDCQRLALAPGGRYVYAYTPGQVVLIDTATNKKHMEQKSSTGSVKSVYAMEADKRLAALTSKALLVWDTSKGDLVKTVEGLHEPYILVEPHRAVQ